MGNRFFHNNIMFFYVKQKTIRIQSISKAGRFPLRLTLREKSFAFRLHRGVQNSLDQGDGVKRAEFQKFAAGYSMFYGMVSGYCGKHFSKTARWNHEKPDCSENENFFRCVCPAAFLSGGCIRHRSTVSWNCCAAGSGGMRVKTCSKSTTRKPPVSPRCCRLPQTWFRKNCA